MGRKKDVKNRPRYTSGVARASPRDLSVQSQLKGRKMPFLGKLTVPSEQQSELSHQCINPFLKYRKQHYYEVCFDSRKHKITEDINVNKMRELRLSIVNNDYDYHLWSPKCLQVFTCTVVFTFHSIPEGETLIILGSRAGGQSLAWFQVGGGVRRWTWGRYPVITLQPVNSPATFTQAVDTVCVSLCPDGFDSFLVTWKDTESMNIKWSDDRGRQCDS